MGVRSLHHRRGDGKATRKKREQPVIAYNASARSDQKKERLNIEIRFCSRQGLGERGMTGTTRRVSPSLEELEDQRGACTEGLVCGETVAIELRLLSPRKLSVLT